MEIKAIETQYKGYRFRSRLEARWAVFFDALGVNWEYEKEGYDLKSVGRYLPDFYIPDKRMWVEVKGESPTADEIEKLNALAHEKAEIGFIVFGQVGEHEWLTDNEFWGFTRPIEQNPKKSWFNSVFSGTWNQDFTGQPFRCPVCEDEYVHFFNAKNIDGKDNYEAWSGRGSAITIEMFCENGGHRWTLLFGFHKGNTYCQINDLLETSNDLGRYLANWNEERYQAAIGKARGARFEHGERG